MIGGAVLHRLRLEGLRRTLEGGELFTFLAQAATGVLVAVAACVFFQVIRGFVFANPERVLCLISLPLLLMSRVLAPVMYPLRRLPEFVLKAFGLETPGERELGISADEISEMVEISSEAGEIEQDEKEMIQGVFTLADTVVREVMTPRPDIIAVPISASLSEVVRMFVSEGLSRVLVIGESLDDVRGILIAKDLMPLVGRSSEPFDIARVMRPPYLVPNTKKIDDLLTDFRRDRIHFAVVLDEHGGVDGVVTVEDLLEEIVGDIFDEYDSPAAERSVFRTKSGDLIIDGAASISDLNETHRLSLPVGEYDTIAGFIMHELGRIPEEGEVVERGPHRIRVDRVTQNRITRVRILSKKPNKINPKGGAAGAVAAAAELGDGEIKPSVARIGISGSR